MSNARQLAANLPREGSLSNRNLIINGAMQVWQRGTSQTTSGYGSADRWQVVNITSASRQTDVPSGFQYSIHIENSSATFPFIAQKWEAANVQHLSGADITLSFWAKSVSGTANLFAEILTPNAVDNYASVTARENTSWANPSTSWVKYTYTFTNVNAAVSNGLEIRIGMQNQSAGSIRITGVQLELGDTATPFEHRSYGDELARCQRYYETCGVGDGGNYEHSRIQDNGTIDFIPPTVRYKVTKRVPAAVTLYGIGGASGVINLHGTNASYNAIFQNGTDHFSVYKNVTGLLNYYFQYDWTADAEL